MDASEKLKTYPDNVRCRIEYLRKLVMEVADEDESEGFAETLRWGQLSYISKYGSTIRIDWNDKSPQEYAMYFHCKTKLVETFKEIYGDIFQYKGSRAIILSGNHPVPEQELKHCISLSLKYHKIKNKPLLGA